MKKNKFTLKGAYDFGWSGLKAKAYTDRKTFKNASAAVFEVTGSHGKVKTKVSDRIYYVLSGRGEFIIKGKKFSVRKKDVVIVPKNTPYDYKAKKGSKLRLFLVHVPAYDPKGEIQLE